MFLRSSKLRILDSMNVPIKTLIRTDPMLQPIFKTRPELLDTVCGKLGMIAQITVAEEIVVEEGTAPLGKEGEVGTNKVYIIANTHLFYHPRADFVRLLQTHAMVKLVEDIKDKLMRGLVRFPPRPSLS